MPTPSVVPKAQRRTETIVKWKSKRLTGFGVGPLSLQWEYVEVNRDVVRRVLTALEDARVLYDEDHREDAEYCRISADKLRHLLTLEIPDVKEGGEVERSFKKMRAAAREFVTAAGPSSRQFLSDYTYFWRCLRALRVGIVDEVAMLAAGFDITLDEPLASYLPTVDVVFIPVDDA